MSRSLFKLLVLAAACAAGGAFAQDHGAHRGAKPPPMPEIPPTPKAPTTCKDQCKLIEDTLKDPCKKTLKNNKNARAACEKNAMNVVNACNASCRQKGYLDKEVMLKNMKIPKGPPPGAEGAPGGGDSHGDEQAHGDAVP